MSDVVTLETPSLGNRSYLVTDGDVAIVIDPQRDVDRFLEASSRLHVRITHVCETHVHNDYVTGGAALADEIGAVYVASADAGIAIDHRGVGDGDEIRTGRLVLGVVATPGHTPDHVSYVLQSDGGATDVFTGGSLLYGAVGRTDLVAEDVTEALARAQFRSAQRLASDLPDDTAVRPTHGFGSHCASTSSDDLARDGTIGDEKRRNPALTNDEDTFVEELLAGLHPYPTYYAAMADLNLAGPAAMDDTPPTPLDAAAIRAHLKAGNWVIDLRSRRAFAQDHLIGTVNVELRNDLATYLGWVMPIDAPLVLLGASPDDVAEAQCMLARVGIERPEGAATGGPGDWSDDDARASWPAASWADLGEALDGRDDVVVLDVRDHWEFVQGHHGRAMHVPFHEVLPRRDEIPGGQVWVSCATGNRAAVAASLLARAGRDVVLIDDFCLPGDRPGT